ncbi:hypothetical protein [Novosphingobium soli]|uniref:DUF4185 domain-containing protein n=1 Tax=Novosphingobium soli TaxID=574956 RepID=A0ABV6CX53_9SPHN
MTWGKIRMAWTMAPLVLVPVAVIAAGEAAPTARYDMRAGTVSGLAGMGTGGTGGMGAAMGMMMGGGASSVQHELYLRLGSAQAPAGGKASADHFVPAGAKLGRSVALVAPPRAQETVPELLPEKPRDRLLIFWGCGEHAPQGQPVVIDFAKVAAGQMPAGMPGAAVVRDWGPTPENARSFARWPAEDRKFVKPDSSLLGAHRVVSTYAPEMDFTLSKDFMAPVTAHTAKLPSGASRLSWTGVAGATAWLAFLTGGKQGPGGTMGDMVMWTSSADRQFGGGLMDWIAPDQAASLVRSGTLLAPAATSCVIPAEVVAASPDFRVGTLTAFGPQESFAYPPRPADPKIAWKPEWTARIRHRSTTSWMQAQGMDLGAAMRGAEDAGAEDAGAEEAGVADAADAREQDRKAACKPRKPSLGGMLGGLGGAVAGGMLGGAKKGC